MKKVLIGTFFIIVSLCLLLYLEVKIFKFDTHQTEQIKTHIVYEFRDQLPEQEDFN